MTDERPKNDGTPPGDGDAEDFSVAIPDDLLEDAVKAVDKRVSDSKRAAQSDEEMIGEEVSVDVESTMSEAAGPSPDDMTVEELVKSGHLPDRVVLAFEEMAARADEMEDQAKRANAAMADADNFRRRVTKEKNDAIKFANEGVLKEILPVVDNLERALSHAESGVAVAGGIKEGVEITLRQFHHILTKLGVTKVSAEAGTPFDPRMHEGVSHQERTDIPSNSVAVCLQPGYMLHERLLRPAMVAVSKNSAKPVEAKAPVATNRAERIREIGQAAREAREQKRLARGARRIEEARETGGDEAAAVVEKAGDDLETKAKERLERVRRAGEAARAARQAKRAEKEAAVGVDAVPDDAAEKQRVEEKLARVRAAGAAARAGRQAKRDAAALEEAEPTVSEDDLAEPTAPGSPADAERRTQEKLERVRRAGAAAREARRAAKAAREIEEAREQGGAEAGAAKSKEEAEKDAAAKARLERIRATGVAARAARAAKRDERAAAAPEAAAAPATKPGAPKPSFEDDDLDSWESSVDAMRTDTTKGRGV